MNDLLLCAASALSEVPTVRSRRVVSAAIGSAAALTLLSCGAELWLIDTSRVLLPAGMALICTAKRGRKPFVRFLLLLWMTALLCGGASFFAAYFFGAHWRANAWVADAPSDAAALGTAGSLLLLAHLRAYRETRRIVRHCAPVRILLLGKLYECTGYFDSGHFLCDPDEREKRRDRGGRASSANLRARSRTARRRFCAMRSRAGFAAASVSFRFKASAQADFSRRYARKKRGSVRGVSRSWRRCTALDWTKRGAIARLCRKT